MGREEEEEILAVTCRVNDGNTKFSLGMSISDPALFFGKGDVFVTLGPMTAEEQKHFDGIRHVVHEYANFVSSAEMTLTGLDIYGKRFEPPINTHVSHAFYLNCRKLSDFFQNVKSKQGDNIMAEHFAPGFSMTLQVSDDWREPINKQLAHTTYTRETNPREIKTPIQQALYDELRDAWRKFRAALPEPFRSEFVRRLQERKNPHPDGQLSEFRFYDLN